MTITFWGWQLGLPTRSLNRTLRATYAIRVRSTYVFAARQGCGNKAGIPRRRLPSPRAPRTLAAGGAGRGAGRPLRPAGGEPRARGVALFGQAGVGKTRLVTEAVESEQAAGTAVEWVRATEAARAIPLGSFAHLLTSGDEVDQRDDLLHLALTRLHERSGGRSFLLAVDDAHLLDEVSVALLHLAVTQSPAIRVLASVRTGEPLPPGLASLWKDELLARLDVAPLGRDATEELALAVLGDGVPASLLDRIWRLSRGNALFLRELVTAAVERQRRAGDDDAPRRARIVLPEEPQDRLRELVEERLRLLAPERPRRARDRGRRRAGAAGGRRAPRRSRRPRGAGGPGPGRDARPHRARRSHGAGGAPPLRRGAGGRAAPAAAPGGAARPGRRGREQRGRRRLRPPAGGHLAARVGRAGPTRPAAGAGPRGAGPARPPAGRAVGVGGRGHRAGPTPAWSSPRRYRARDASTTPRPCSPRLHPADPEQVARIAIARASDLFLHLDRSSEAFDVLRMADDDLDGHPAWQAECRSVLAQMYMFSLRLGEAGEIADQLLADAATPEPARVRAVTRGGQRLGRGRAGSTPRSALIDGGPPRLGPPPPPRRALRRPPAADGPVPGPLLGRPGPRARRVHRRPVGPRPRAPATVAAGHPHRLPGRGAAAAGAHGGGAGRAAAVVAGADRERLVRAAAARRGHAGPRRRLRRRARPGRRRPPRRRHAYAADTAARRPHAAVHPAVAGVAAGRTGRGRRGGPAAAGAGDGHGAWWPSHWRSRCCTPSCGSGRPPTRCRRPRTALDAVDGPFAGARRPARPAPGSPRTATSSPRWPSPSRTWAPTSWRPRPTARPTTPTGGPAGARRPRRPRPGSPSCWHDAAR